MDMTDVDAGNAVATPPDPGHTTGRFTLVDGIRGMAAVGIASYHIHRYGPLPEAADELLPEFVQSVLNCSWIGVQFFFVLAGFVAAHSLRNRHVSPGLIGNNVLRRLARLGVPYWVAILTVLVLNSYVIRVLNDDSLAGIVSSRQAAAQFVFVQDILAIGNVFAGIWFVAIDLQFGLLFVVLVGLAQQISGGHPRGSWRRSASLLAVTVPLGWAAAFYFNQIESYDCCVLYFFHMPALGVLAWWALDRQIPRAAFWIYAATMLTSLIDIDQQQFIWRPEIVIATFAAVILYIAGRTNRLHTSLAGRPFQYLGRISYSLFLVHDPVRWVVVSIGYNLTGASPAAAIGWLVLALTASLAFAHLFYLWVEAPANRLAQRFR